MARAHGFPKRISSYATGGGFSTVTTAAGAYNQSLSIVTFRAVVRGQYDGRYRGKETFTATGSSIKRKSVATSSVTVKIGSGQCIGIGQIIAASVSEPVQQPDFYRGIHRRRPLETSRRCASINPRELRTRSAHAVRHFVERKLLDGYRGVRAAVRYARRRSRNGSSAGARSVNASAQHGRCVAERIRRVRAGPTTRYCGYAALYVFAAGSFGKTTISRRLTGPTSCAASELAVDGTGVLYVYVPPNRTERRPVRCSSLLPNTSGNVPPAAYDLERLSIESWSATPPEICMRWIPIGFR